MATRWQAESTPNSRGLSQSISHSCPTLCDLIDCSPLGSSVHEVLQTRILEWVAVPAPGNLPEPGIVPASPMSPALQADSLPLSHWGSASPGPLVPSAAAPPSTATKLPTLWVRGTRHIHSKGISSNQFKPGVLKLCKITSYRGGGLWSRRLSVRLSGRKECQGREDTLFSKYKHIIEASLVPQLVKNLPATRETWVRSLGWEDPLEEGMGTHSSVLAWRIPMDRGAQQAVVHWVAKRRTWLSN